MMRENEYNLIAEIGCNHQGDLAKAKEMISAAKKCGCSIIKLQKREPRLQFSPEKYNQPHPNQENAFGKTYGEHREKLEFSQVEHKELMEYAQSLGLEYSCSVFDIVSAKKILEINPSHIKIPSPVNNNLEIVEMVAKSFNGKIHVSLGMTTRDEETALIALLKQYGKLKNTILYHCVSSYPTKDADVSLLELSRLKEFYGNDVFALGLSGHHLDSLPDCLALAMGASFIERHFTFDKLAKGSDHRLSLDYEEMSLLNSNLRRVQNMLKYKPKEILDCELSTYNFHKYKKSV